MTPVPLDLPLRPSEAAELANLIFDHAERKPLTDDVRNRVAARAAALRLETINPYFGSLERDPVHPGAYYLAVDAIGDSSHLLYMALSTAPTSSIFHRPLLIGRMRRADGPEVVINATPFGPADRQNIDLFVSRIDSAFLPSPRGLRFEIAVAGDAPAAFEVFRAVHKRTGKNVAALTGDYHAGLWAAIRAGWRHGYAAIADSTAAGLPYSRFCVPAQDLPPKEAARIHEQIRQTRAQRKIAGAFEFEVGLPKVTPEELDSALAWLKTSGHAAQFIAPEAIQGELAQAADTARRHQATLSFRYRGADVQEIMKATLGRVSFRVETAEEVAHVAESL